MKPIETINLTIGYSLRNKKSRIVHSNLNLSLEKGELTCLLGLNGAGKSTLIKTLCGFTAPIGGQISISGKNLNDYSAEEMARTIGVVLTEKTNAGGITVYDLVSLGRYPYSGFFGQLSENDHAIIMQALKSVGIDHKSGSYISELSDGERQKAFIAKVLAQECPIIILDEPTSFLDIVSRIDILFLLKSIAKEQQKSILLSTHDIDTAIKLADRLWLLPDAKDENVTIGSPNELIDNGKLEKMYNFELDSEKNKIIKEILKRSDGIQY